ncbi:TVP38/TMEM64 family protein [Bacillus sp. EAC]|uniref:TVP38/TMEM64 family protein n=1 Tax=Bacillus sp. EAC TaxID=1978338 RepID=UPI00211ACA55|nr:VTT domain-containing protein [Bacillus sp. EAC]
MQKKKNMMKELSIHVLLAAVSIFFLLEFLPTVVSIYKGLFTFAIMSILLLDFYLVLSNHKKILKVTKIALVLILICISVVGLIFYITKFLVFADTYGVERILIDHISIAKLIFFTICFFQPIFLPIPEAVTLPAGSAVLGSFQGAYIGFLGSISGIVVMYFLARIGGLKLVAKFVKEKHLKRYQEYVSKNETIILTLMFIIPILPDEIICVGAGISKVSFKRFIIIASISKLVTSSLLSYSVYLAKLFSLSATQLIFGSSIIILFVFLLSFIIKKSIKKANAKEVYMTSHGE